MDFRSEFLPESEHIPGSAALGKYSAYHEWLDHVIAAKAGLPERDLVASTQYLAFTADTGRLVGCIQLRNSLNNYLENYGGHIGYSVRPSERRKGYASSMLAECLTQAASIGLNRVLITCDEDNLASEGVIRKAGGIYEDTRDEPNSRPKKRFWIDIS